MQGTTGGSGGGVGGRCGSSGRRGAGGGSRCPFTPRCMHACVRGVVGPCWPAARLLNLAAGIDAGVDEAVAQQQGPPLDLRTDPWSQRPFTHQHRGGGKRQAGRQPGSGSRFAGCDGARLFQYPDGCAALVRFRAPAAKNKAEKRPASIMKHRHAATARMQEAGITKKRAPSICHPPPAAAGLAAPAAALARTSSPTPPAPAAAAAGPSFFTDRDRPTSAPPHRMNIVPELSCSALVL